MRIIAPFIACLLCLLQKGYAFYSPPLGLQFVEEKRGPRHFSVIYVAVDEKTTREQAKDRAVRRAALISYQHNCRYFMIDSEEKVQVVKSGSVEKLPENLYQELIIEQDGGKGYITPTEIYPGYKIVFRCTNTKPTSVYYDTCSYMKCKEDRK